MRLLSQRFADRAVLIVSSDHGEAFGEHDTFYHTKTVYEELLHVPLFIQGRGIKPRRVGRRVTLVDLGPTILDLFGVETPSGFMGQSLVPLLAGRDVKLDRPIFAEGRLRRAFYMENGLKVIEDARRKTVEAYDLTSDPRELTNLFDTERERVRPGLVALRRFFDVHAFAKPGYETPYKP
jgi:arylsulfatase A-like enzyme